MEPTVAKRFQAVTKEKQSAAVSPSLPAQNQQQPSPLTVVSRILATPASLKQGRLSLVQQVRFQVLHTALHVFYLFVFILQYAVGHYHRLKLKMQMVFYYHNRTPQLIRQDVSQFAKIPGHIAVVFQLKENEEGGGVDGLLDQSGEVAAWCIGAGASTLTIYERSGTLKQVPASQLHRAVARKLASYFGDSRPSFKINSLGAEPVANGDTVSGDANPALTINVLSEEDGRETVVDLTRTLAEMAKEQKIKVSDLSVESIDREIRQLTITEPDLLILFTPIIDLAGFPPWPIRLTEIAHEADNEEVSYMVFYKALQRYSNCKINVGR